MARRERTRAAPANYAGHSHSNIVDLRRQEAPLVVSNDNVSSIAPRRNSSLLSEEELVKRNLDRLRISEAESIGDTAVRALATGLTGQTPTPDVIANILRSTSPVLFTVGADLQSLLAPDTRLASLFPKTAPEEWSKRPSRKSEPAFAFLRRVYAPWLHQDGLRLLIRDLDRPLYMALSKAVHDHGVPDDLKTALKSSKRSTAEVDAELERFGIAEPSDARNPDLSLDQGQIERFYNAASHREL